jgi:hypothetical protein
MQSTKFYLHSLHQRFLHMKNILHLRTKTGRECKSCKVEFLQFACLISTFQMDKLQQLTET